MAKRRGDTGTMDLLDWKPPKAAARFEDEEVRAATLSARIGRAIAVILKECEKSREEVAAEMSEFLGEDVSKAMLDAYCSQAREGHNISLVRAEALLHATGDPRIFGDILERHGFAVIPKRYLKAIDQAYWADVKQYAAKREKESNRGWKRGQS